MLLRTVIVEDEAPSLERLKTMLSAIQGIELVGEASDGPDGVELIDTLKPDLAFLDIQLPVFTSFDLLRRIRHKPNIIFVTAYDEYAIRAFEANAVDYLLKPTTPERLREAIDRASQRSVGDSRLLSVVESILNKKKFRDRFTVKIGDEILFIPAGEVCWFEADDRYVLLHTSDRHYVLDETLRHLESELDPDQFIRIHKSVIIHTEKLNRVRRDFLGHYKIHLNDAKKSVFEIGRTYLPSVREKLRF